MAADVGARLIDGAAVARTVRERVAGEVAELAGRGVVPGLSVVLVGDDPASAVYVRNKERFAREAGMRGETIRMPATTSQDELLAVVSLLEGQLTATLHLDDADTETAARLRRLMSA